MAIFDWHVGMRSGSICGTFMTLTLSLTLKGNWRFCNLRIGGRFSWLDVHTVTPSKVEGELGVGRVKDVDHYRRA